MGVPQKVNKEEARALRAQGWKVKDIASRQGCDSSQVSRACQGVLPPTEHRRDPVGNLPKANVEKMRRSAERREIARSLRLQGMTILQIAAKTGFGRHAVSRYCKGLTVRPIGNSADKNHGRVVPLWVVRADLVEDFRDVLRERGEEAAASHCRRLKAEAMRCAA